MIRRQSVFYSIAMTALIGLMLAGVFWGTANISWAERFAVLSGSPDAPRGMSLIIWEWRLPRVIAVALVGAALALAGCLMQTALRNPMADPYLMGVSSGASAAAVGAMIWLPGWVTGMFGIPIISFFGAAFAFTLTYRLASGGKRGLDPLVVILAGVAISLMFQSLTAFFLFIGDPHATRSALGWLMGTAAGTRWHELPPLAFAVFAIGFMAWRHVAMLDAMLMGDERAEALGVRTKLMRTGIFWAAVILTGASVAVVGIVGFVGLIVPHMARLLLGARHKNLLPSSMILGAIVLVSVDLACRIILAPEEMPLGVLLALLAAPPFIFILRTIRNVG